MNNNLSASSAVSPEKSTSFLRAISKIVSTLYPGCIAVGTFTCVNPIAPASLTAFGLPLLSTNIKALINSLRLFNIPPLLIRGRKDPMPFFTSPPSAIPLLAI